MGAYGNTAQASKAAPATQPPPLTLGLAAAPTAGGLTQITLSLSSAASVQATILNLAGREVVALPEQRREAGLSGLLWDGRAKAGTKAPPGRYLVRVRARAPDGSEARALAVLSLAR